MSLIVDVMFTPNIEYWLKRKLLLRRQLKDHTLKTFLLLICIIIYINVRTIGLKCKKGIKWSMKGNRISRTLIMARKYMKMAKSVQILESWT